MPIIWAFLSNLVSCGILGTLVFYVFIIQYERNFRLKLRVIVCIRVSLFWAFNFLRPISCFLFPKLINTHIHKCSNTDPETPISSSIGSISLAHVHTFTIYIKTPEQILVSVGHFDDTKKSNINHSIDSMTSFSSARRKWHT